MGCFNPQKSDIDLIVMVDRPPSEPVKEEIAEHPMYLTLNLARVLAYREAGVVLSKKEGGDWALRHLPAEYRPLTTNALREYTESAELVYDEVLAKRYAEYMLSRIKQ